MITEQSPSPDPPAVLADVFNFPWHIMGESAWTEYIQIGARATVMRIIGLATFNSLAIFLGILSLTVGNPYIRLNSYLEYPPFLIAFAFMPIIAFLFHSTAHFLCFRAVSGKGNLTAHNYVSVLASTSFVLLFWFAILVLYVTRLRGVENLILGAGGICIICASCVSIAAVHKVSAARFIGGFVLSVIASLPLYIGYMFLLSFLAEAKSNNTNIWLIIPVFICILLVSAFIIIYMVHQRKLIDTYPEMVPLKAPLETMLKAKQ